MAAGGGAIISAGEAIAKDFVKGFTGAAEVEAPGFYRSARALLDKTDIGKVWGNYLEHTFKPEVAKTGQQLLTHKIASGIAPKQAALDAGWEALHDTRKRLIGPNDEALIKFIHTATKKEGVIYGNQMADAMSVYFEDTGNYWRHNAIKLTPGAQPIDLKSVGIRQTVKYTKASEVENQLKRSLSWMYTPLIALPHVGQLSNIILDNSIKDVAQGVGEYFSKGITKRQFQQDLLDSGTMFEENRMQILADAQGGGLMRKLVDHPGFSHVRRVEISVAAATGKHAAINAAEKFNRVQDSWSGHTLAKLGINPQEVLRQGGALSPEQIQKAMYSEANRTIFMRDALQTPWRWEENIGMRLNSQYRHYIFRQGRFLSEVFKNSYKFGGGSQLTKAIATYAIVYPVFGEIVHSLENLATAQNPFHRDSKTWYGEGFDALGHSAGLAIFYSMWRSAQYNNGAGFFTGPALNTVIDVGMGIHDIAHTNSHGRWKPKWQSAAHRFVSKAGIPGKIIAPMLKKKKRK